MQHRIIPGNLHFNTPNPDIPALKDGRLQVVNKNTSWDGGTVGINSFGFGGANVHTILKPCSIDGENQTDKTARLVTIAGRDGEKVRAALELAKQHPDDLAMHYMMSNGLCWSWQTVALSRICHLKLGQRSV